MDSLNWLVNWYEYHCDGNWEHDYGFVIRSQLYSEIYICIDLIGTNLEFFNFKNKVLEEGKNYSIQINENKQYVAMGHYSKVDYFIKFFKDLNDANGGYKFKKTFDDIITKYQAYGIAMGHLLSYHMMSLYHL